MSKKLVVVVLEVVVVITIGDGVGLLVGAVWIEE